MANSQETYSYIADPWQGRWTVANNTGTLAIELKQGQFCVGNNAFALFIQARDYALEKLNIPKLLSC
ncbi:MAG: hypothetical protein IJ776_09345 [Paludibacteraceae bacterium]|nr:hypothetical protein [Paludibacteraceae bacterium]